MQFANQHDAGALQSSGSICRRRYMGSWQSPTAHGWVGIAERKLGRLFEHHSAETRQHRPLVGAAFNRATLATAGFESPSWFQLLQGLRPQQPVVDEMDPGVSTHGWQFFAGGLGNQVNDQVQGSGGFKFVMNKVRSSFHVPTFPSFWAWGLSLSTTLARRSTIRRLDLKTLGIIQDRHPVSHKRIVENLTPVSKLENRRRFRVKRLLFSKCARIASGHLAQAIFVQTSSCLCGRAILVVYFSICQLIRHATSLSSGHEQRRTRSPSRDATAGPLASRTTMSPRTATSTDTPTRRQPRLWLPLPLTSRTCRCGRLFDVHGHHRAACSRAGVLGSRGFLVESTAARVCREAGVRMSTKCFRPRLGPHKWSATTDDGSSLPSVGTVNHATCADHDGAALAQACRRKQRTYPELGGSRTSALGGLGCRSRWALVRGNPLFRESTRQGQS